jgi:hypothetical protein
MLCHISKSNWVKIFPLTPTITFLIAEAGFIVNIILFLYYKASLGIVSIPFLTNIFLISRIKFYK